VLTDFQFFTFLRIWLVYFLFCNFTYVLLFNQINVLLRRFTSMKVYTRALQKLKSYKPTTTYLPGGGCRVCMSQLTSGF
jgi:hypothetical protein